MIKTNLLPHPFCGMMKRDVETLYEIAKRMHKFKLLECGEGSMKVINGTDGEILYKRIRTLMAMDWLATNLNNENSEELWLSEGVPDGADFLDYSDIAMDDEMYDHVKKVFFHVTSRWGEGGWCV